MEPHHVERKAPEASSDVTAELCAPLLPKAPPEHFATLYQKQAPWRQPAIECHFSCGLSWRTPPLQLIPPHTEQLMWSVVHQRAMYRQDEDLGELDPAAAFNEIAESSLGWVLDEILKNASDAYGRLCSPNNFVSGEIEVYVGRSPTKICIDVSDSGIGISSSRTGPGEIWVASNSPPDGAGGISLNSECHFGLKWCKAVVELHGGDIQILSPGRRGFKTTVSLVFPVEAVG